MQRGDVRTETPHFSTRVMHVITGLDVGGAEVSLLKLLATLDRSAFESAVVTLKGTGTVAEQIMSLEIPVYSANIRTQGIRVGNLRQLLRTVSSWRPELIQGWMYHGNLAASTLSRLMKGRLPVAWNVRHSIDRLAEEKTRTRWVIRAGALVSRQATRIIYNSHVSAQQHERIGYNRCRTVVIPNGFDPDSFRPSAERRRSLCDELEISKNTIVVGMVARYHPMKDHNNFLEAAKRIQAARSNVVFLMAGRGVSPQNAALKKRIGTSAFGGSVRLLGEVEDVPALMAALDILVSASSCGEGFPNVVGEAMAAGVPCVVTDTGDSAVLVGDHGFVVPPRNETALATAVTTLIDMGSDARMRIGLQARDRIVNNYSLENSAARYTALYNSVLAKDSSPVREKPTMN